MNDKIKGTAVGAALSLVAIVLWIILSYIGLIAGIAGALMGILFTIGYKKVNKNDNSKYVIVAACILIIIEIIIAELIAIAIAAQSVGITFSEAFSYDDIKSAILLDILIGLLLSFGVFIGYLISINKKSQLNNRRIYTNQPEPTQTIETEVFDVSTKSKETEPVKSEQEQL